MKTKYILAVLIVMSFISCTKSRINPSGNITKRSYDFSDFTSIIVSSGINVIYTDTAWEYVEVVTDDNVHPVLSIRQNGKSLIFGVQNPVAFTRGPNVKIYVYGPIVNQFVASGGSDISINGVMKESAIEYDGSGGGRISGTIQCDKLQTNISGGGSARLNGSSQNLEINSSGGSSFSDFDFQSDVLEANVSGGGTVKVTVNSELNVDASGGSTIIYKGNGVIRDINLTGGSQILHQ